MLQIAVLGYGTVGSGIVEVIERNQNNVNQKALDEIHVKYVLDLREFKGNPVEKILVHDFDTIVKDDEVSIVCEAMGGEHPAYDFTKQAILAGKSVCTSNKEVVEKHGAELIALAKEHHCNYMFEASVGGGIPIIRPMLSSLAPEKILSIKGILNGTTNYILTKMEQDGADFGEVLSKAQELGYAERNPEADIEGYDAGRKIAILSSLAFGKDVDFKEIQIEGITGITTNDFQYAKTLGMTIKLLGMCQQKEEKTYVLVSPFMITKENPLYSVSDVFNAIVVESNMLGETMYYGKGAGKLATASAVVADVIACAKHLNTHIEVQWDEEKMLLSDTAEMERRFFVRTDLLDEDEISKIYGKIEMIPLSLEQEKGFFTEVMSEKEFEERKQQDNQFLNRIRLL